MINFYALDNHCTSLEQELYLVFEVRLISHSLLDRGFDLPFVFIGTAYSWQLGDLRHAFQLVLFVLKCNIGCCSLVSTNLFHHFI